MLRGRHAYSHTICYLNELWLMLCKFLQHIKENMRNDILIYVHLLQRADELHEEVILSWTLNKLRECETEAQNSCPTFIKTQEYVFSGMRISWRCLFVLL